jgi:hypothetical protein
VALINLNGAAVLDGSSLYFSRTGAWHAELRVDTQSAIGDGCEINIADGALVLEGTADRSGLFADTGFVRVVAGANGLGTTAKPKHYDDPTIRVVLADLLANAGEVISSTADASILGRHLTAWTTTARPTGPVVSLLVQQAPNTSWRMLPDGTLWVGTESWPDSGLDPTTYQILDELPSDGSADLGMDAPLLIAGVSLAGRHVSAVEHRIDGRGVRARVWFEP